MRRSLAGTRWLERWPRMLALAASVLAASAPAGSEDGFRPQDFRTTAVFELRVETSGVLRPGPSKIVAKSAFATRVRGLMPGNSAGLELLFLSEPITEASRADVLERHARDLRKRDHAVLVLFLDAQGKIWQVNLTYVIRGTTVARTVAWQPAELAEFSRYTLDGKRLVLKSNGLYRESSGEQFTLSWDVDVSVPVLDPAKP
jgi:hypothetical protein